MYICIRRYPLTIRTRRQPTAENIFQGVRKFDFYTLPDILPGFRGLRSAVAFFLAFLIFAALGPRFTFLMTTWHV